jgi:hypothetical protein
LQTKALLHIEDSRTGTVQTVKGTFEGRGFAAASIMGRNGQTVTLCWDADSLDESDSRKMFREDTGAWTAYLLLTAVSQKK